MLQWAIHHWKQDSRDSAHSQDDTGGEAGAFTLSLKPVAHSERDLPDRGTSQRKVCSMVRLGPTGLDESRTFALGLVLGLWWDGLMSRLYS